jgi:hypothetical protein
VHLVFGESMAYDSVRRQLDQLLGVDRNELHPRRDSSERLRYDDPRVCKEYLLGLCLASLSDKRRGTEMLCERSHSEQVLRNFREDDERGRVRDKIIWERALASACRAIVLEEDRRIQGIAHRLKDMYGFTEPLNAIIVKDLGTLQSLGLLADGVKFSSDGLLSEDEVLPENVNDALAPDTAEAAKAKSFETMHAVANPDNPERVNEPPQIKILNVTSDQRTEKVGRSSGDGVSSPSDREMSASDSCGSTDEAPQESTKTNRGLGEGQEGKESRVEVQTANATSQAIRLVPSEGPASKVESDVQEPNDVMGGDTESKQERDESESSGVRFQPRRDGKFDVHGTGPHGLLLNREYKLRVCGQCGGLISLHDAESRLATHYSGKAHTSAVAVRQKLDELDAALASATATHIHVNTARPGSHTGNRGSRSKRAFAEDHHAHDFKRQRRGGYADNLGQPRAHSPRRAYRWEHTPESDSRINRNGGGHVGSRGDRHGSEAPRRESHRFQSRDERRRYER